MKFNTSVKVFQEQAEDIYKKFNNTECQDEIRWYARRCANWMKKWDTDAIKDVLRIMAQEGGDWHLHEKGRATVWGIFSTLKAFGFPYREAWLELMLHFPDNFSIISIPGQLLYEGYNRAFCTLPLEKIVKFDRLVEQLPDGQLVQASDYDQEMDYTVKDSLRVWYLRELGMMQRYWDETVENGGRPDVIWSEFRQAGSQWISEFQLFNRAKPNNPEDINFHGQNTSQWNYAGCILVDGNRVSTHH